MPNQSPSFTSSGHINHFLGLGEILPCDDTEISGIAGRRCKRYDNVDPGYARVYILFQEDNMWRGPYRLFGEYVMTVLD